MNLLINEIQILKNIRHPNLEMHLGVTYSVIENTDQNENKTLIYRFFMITENILFQYNQ